MEHLPGGRRQRDSGCAARGWPVHGQSRRVLPSGRLQGPDNSGALCVAQPLSAVSAHGAVFFARWRKDLGSQLDLRTLEIERNMLLTELPVWGIFALWFIATA